MTKAKKKPRKLSPKSDTEKLNQIIQLLQTLTTIELFRSGVTQQQIGKHLGIAKATVSSMLKGVKQDSL